MQSPALQLLESTLVFQKTGYDFEAASLPS
jgi:hypothetical protein